MAKKTDIKEGPEYFYYKKDRLNQLRGFCYTVQNDCNVSRAAEKMRVEATSVSKQIRSLERDLNVTLFNRNNQKKLELTSEGRKFYNKSILQLQGMDGLFTEFLEEHNHEYQNTIRIATFDSIIERMLPLVLKFKEENPEVKFLFFNISKEEAFSLLINDELDLAIYPTDFNELPPIELDRTEIAENISYLVLYKGHPLENKDEKDITEDDLLEYPLGLFPIGDEKMYSKSFEDFSKKHRVKSPINIKFASISLNKELVRSKLCITFIDNFWLDKKDKNEFVLKKDHIFPPMYFYYFYRRNIKLKNMVNSFLLVVVANKNKIFY